MKKAVFKKILSILDYIEIKGLTVNKAMLETKDRLKEDGYQIEKTELQNVFDLLVKFHYLKLTKHGIDLSPPATILCKSNQGSIVEALATLECIIQYEDYATFMKQWWREETYYHKVDLYNELDEHTVHLLSSSTLVSIKDHEYYMLNPAYQKEIKMLIEEYEQEHPLLTTTLKAHFAKSIVSQLNHVEYKNTTNEIVAYPNKKIIMSVIPKRGIPKSRDETKSLQSFYKDTLFHEYEHCCPLCGIDLPYMLIASHIKPFRDCAHIYEAIDHNNGILLCRNHDFLFDQGYITFDEKGYIIICNELLDKKHLEENYVIRKNMHLDDVYLTKERRLFLEYHRNCIFKK